jgi:hypothetical protein
MKRISINRWVYIVTVLAVTVGLGHLLSFAFLQTSQLASSNLHWYGLIALLLLLPLLTFPLGIVGLAFTAPFISSGIFETSEAFVVASPIFAIMGYFQWYFLYPRFFGRPHHSAPNTDSSPSSSAHLGITELKISIVHMCIPLGASFITAAIGISHEPFAFDVVLTFLLSGFMFYTAPYILWAIVAFLGKFSKQLWHAGYTAATVALLVTSAFWLAPRDASGLPIQWILYWPLALALMLFIWAGVLFVRSSKLSPP